MQLDEGRYYYYRLIDWLSNKQNNNSPGYFIARELNLRSALDMLLSAPGVSSVFRWISPRLASMMARRSSISSISSEGMQDISSFEVEFGSGILCRSSSWRDN